MLRLNPFGSRLKVTLRFGRRFRLLSICLLSNECKRVLAYAAEEAERLSHKHIGTEHLLLGLLREEKCFAAEILHERGLASARHSRGTGAGYAGEGSPFAAQP